MAYSGWELDEEDRAKLLALIPTAYPDVIAHHITLEHGKTALLVPPEAQDGEIVGFADDGEAVQAVIVRIAGTTERPAGGRYHITWSIDREKGAKPVDSNRVIAERGVTPFVFATRVKLHPKVFAPEQPPSTS